MLHLIELKTVEDPYFKTVPGESDEQRANRREANRVDYKDMILSIIQRGNGQGFTMEDVEKGSSVLKELRKVDTGDTLVLEDADYQYMMQRVREHRYGIVDERIVDFKADLESAPTEDPNAKPASEATNAEPEASAASETTPEPAANGTEPATQEAAPVS